MHDPTSLLVVRSSADEKRALGGDDLRADLVDVAFAEQTRRRAVVELRVQPLEPCARDLRSVDLCDRLRDLERESQSPLYYLARLAVALGPFVDRTGFLHRAEVGTELQAEDLAQRC